MTLRSYFLISASEPKLTSPEEVQEAIRGLKASEAQGQNGIPNRTLKHLPQGAVSLLVLIFNAILVTHHFPTVWKLARVISILKPGMDPAMRSNAGMANRQWDVDLRFAQVDVPIENIGLAWR